MRSKIGRRLVDETPLEDKIFLRKYAAIVAKVHDLLEQKGLSQRELAERMGKSPSELSRWLKGEHNLTLRSLSRLEAELGEEIVTVERCSIGVLGLPKQALVMPNATSVSDTNWAPLQVAIAGHARKTATTVA